MTIATRRRSLVRKALVALAALAVAALAPMPVARADVVSAASDAYLVSADLRLTVFGAPIPGGDLPPQVLVAGTAPGAYGESASAAQYERDAGAFSLGSVSGQVLRLEAASVHTAAASGVDGLGGPRSTSGSIQIGGLALDVLSYTMPYFGSGTLVRVTAAAVSAGAAVMGDRGALIGAGSLNVVDLAVTVGDDQFLFNGAIAPNTIVELAEGVTLTLNEQVLGGDGVDEAGLLTNFLRLHFDRAGVPAGYRFLGLNGDVVVGHTFARQAGVAPVVPEPSSVALAGLGLGAAGLAAARRARRQPGA